MIEISNEAKEALLTELEEKGEIIRCITSEPAEIDAVVADIDGDRWIKGERGWGIMRGDGGIAWSTVMTYGPLWRVR